MTNNGYGQAYESGFERTVRFLISRGAQEDRARETAQAAWVQGLERLCQLRDDSMVIAWVNTIALNTFRRVRRREAPMLPLNNFAGGFSVDVVVIDLNAIDLRKALGACGPPNALSWKSKCGASRPRKLQAMRASARQPFGSGCIGPADPPVCIWKIRE